MKKVLFLLSIFFLTGCYNYTELNDLAIVKGASIDIENNEYILNYIVDSNTIFEGRGTTISDAIAEMNLSSQKELYIGHMTIYVISEEVAKKGTKDIIDYFFRSSSSKKTFQIVISKNSKANSILKSLFPTDNFPTDNIIRESSLSSFTINTSLLSFVKKIKDPGIEPVASGITIVDNQIKIEPLAIFKNDKFIKWENKEISEGITILYNQSNQAKINANCNGKKVVFLLSDIEVKKEFKIDEKVNFNFKIKANTEISEMTCNLDLKNLNDLKELEKLLIYTLKNMLNNTIEEIKKTKIDSIGLGYYIYQNDYKNYKKIKDDYLNNLNVQFEIIPNLLAFENNNEGTVKIDE